MAGHLFCYMTSIGLIILSIGYVELVKPALLDYLSARDGTEKAESTEDKLI